MQNLTAAPKACILIYRSNSWISASPTRKADGSEVEALQRNSEIKNRLKRARTAAILAAIEDAT